VRPAVFLDRDGTIVEEAGYLDRLERLVFFPYSIDAIRMLNRAGFAVVVITNQAGIARGIVREAFVAETHRYIADRAAAGGAHIDGFYYCPHYPSGTVTAFVRACDCRKPGPGMLRQAAADLDLDLTRSFSVGDRWHDVGAGASVGARRARAHRSRGARRSGAGGRDDGGGDCGRSVRCDGVDSGPGMKAPAMIEPGRLLRLIDELAGCRVAIVGDLIADEFIYGEIARVSREAPVLILNYDSTEVVPGGAGNAAGNVATLGGAATVTGVVGRDEPGGRLLETLKKRRVDARSVLRPAGYTTPTKTRILAGGIHSAKQQVVRIDRGASGAIDERICTAFRQHVMRAVRGADAMLLSDYGSGLVSPSLVAEARRVMRPRKGTRGPIVVDSRYNLLAFRGITACTPNESEVEHALGIRIGDNVRALERAGRAVLRQTRAEAVLITRGSRGMALFEPDRPTRHIPIVGSDQIADVTGAGDTVIATLTLALSAGATFEEAAHLANHAGGLVVMKRGTATVSASELRYAISGGTIGRPA
jgi:rfaE bifunctional protein kinase chain/domain